MAPLFRHSEKIVLDVAKSVAKIVDRWEQQQQTTGAKQWQDARQQTQVNYGLKYSPMTTSAVVHVACTIQPVGIFRPIMFMPNQSMAIQSTLMTSSACVDRATIGRDHWPLDG